MKFLQGSTGRRPGTNSEDFNETTNKSSLQSNYRVSVSNLILQQIQPILD